jgi:hypothetical protein
VSTFLTTQAGAKIAGHKLGIGCGMKIDEVLQAEAKER